MYHARRHALTVFAPSAAARRVHATLARMEFPEETGLLERDVHFGVAAGCGGVHARGDAFKMQLHERPSGRPGQNDKGDLAARQILLVADSLIRGEQEINGRILGYVQQIAVGQPIPTSGSGRDYRVAAKSSCNAPRRSVVKQNEHRPARKLPPAPTLSGSAPQIRAPM